MKGWSPVVLSPHGRIPCLSTKISGSQERSRPRQIQRTCHIGFVLQFGNGRTIYITGDTDHHELLYSVTKHQPDIVITCINGGFNNLSAWEAAQLVSVVKPKVAIPCHYDMFPDNCSSPSQFRGALNVQAPSATYHELEHGSPFVFSAV